MNGLRGDRAAHRRRGRHRSPYWLVGLGQGTEDQVGDGLGGHRAPARDQAAVTHGVRRHRDGGAHIPGSPRTQFVLQQKRHPALHAGQFFLDRREACDGAVPYERIPVCVTEVDEGAGAMADRGDDAAPAVDGLGCRLKVGAVGKVPERRGPLRQATAGIRLVLSAVECAQTMTNAMTISRAPKERNSAGRSGRSFRAMDSTRPSAPRKTGTARK